MPCVELATNATLSAPQMPSGIPNTYCGWFKISTAGVFGDVFLSDTATPDTNTSDAKFTLNSPNFTIVNKGVSLDNGTATPSTNTWYFYVCSQEDGGNIRFRIFADNAPTLTKVDDFTSTFFGTTGTKRYVQVQATSGSIRHTAGAIIYGAAPTDTECRTKAVTRAATTVSGGTMWDVYDLTDHTVLTGANGHNLSSTGTLSTVAGDQPASIGGGGGGGAAKHRVVNSLLVTSLIGGGVVV